MKLSGLVKNSFVDFPGRIAAVLFTPGCNFDCYFCHNRHLLSGEATLIDTQETLAFLAGRKRLLEGVVISGGEPTLQADLTDFIGKLKEMGYAIKLDTNGSQPEVVASLIENKLVDYIAMDVKAPWDKYPSICCAPADKVRETLALLKKNQVPFEIRTTYLPELSTDDILDIALAIHPVPLYALQEYRVPEKYPSSDKERILQVNHGTEDFKAAEKAAAACGGKVIVRR